MTPADYAALLEHLHAPRMWRVDCGASPLDPPGAAAAAPEDPRHLIAALQALSPSCRIRCLYFAGCELLPRIEWGYGHRDGPRIFMERAREWLTGTKPAGADLLSLANSMSAEDIPMPPELTAPALLSVALSYVFYSGHVVFPRPEPKNPYWAWQRRFQHLLPPIHDAATAEIEWADLPPVPPRPEPEVLAAESLFLDELHTARCRCGTRMAVTPAGVSHHLDNDGEVDHDRDADHVAVADVEPDSEPAPRPRSRRTRRPRKRAAKHVD